MDRTRRRKNLRFVLAILVVIPVALLILHLIFERDFYGGDSILEMVYLILGVPILVFNLWAWYHPEIIEFLFWGDKGDQG